MQRKQVRKTKLFLVQLAIVIINTLLFAAVWNVFYKNKLWGDAFYGRGNWLVIVLFLFTLLTARAFTA